MEFSAVHEGRKKADGILVYAVQHQGEDVTRNGKPCTIELFGPHSAEAKLALARMTKARDAAGLNRPIEGKSVERIADDRDRDDRIGQRYFADMTAGWDNIPDLSAPAGDDGIFPDLAFTTAAAEALYRDHGWILAGITAFLADAASGRTGDGSA